MKIGTARTGSACSGIRFIYMNINIFYLSYMYVLFLLFVLITLAILLLCGESRLVLFKLLYNILYYNSKIEI